MLHFKTAFDICNIWKTSRKVIYQFYCERPRAKWLKSGIWYEIIPFSRDIDFKPYINFILLLYHTFSFKALLTRSRAAKIRFQTNQSFHILFNNT